MNLQRVSKNNGARVMLTCNRCGERFRVEEMYADIAGTPFDAFYCEPCAESIAPDQVDGLLTFAQHK